MSRYNFLLELINGCVIIVTTSFVVWCTLHLRSEFKQRKLTWRDAILNLPSVSIVVAMFIEHLGNWVRIAGFLFIENLWISFGSLVSVAGLLWLTAILSWQKYGNRPWLTTTGVTICFALLYSLYYFSRSV